MVVIVVRMFMLVRVVSMGVAIVLFAIAVIALLVAAIFVIAITMLMLFGIGMGSFTILVIFLPMLAGVMLALTSFLGPQKGATSRNNRQG